MNKNKKTKKQTKKHFSYFLCIDYNELFYKCCTPRGQNCQIQKKLKKGGG